MRILLSEDTMVSICCVTYNQKQYITKAVDSFLMQETRYKYEIIIQDDASTDGTQQILMEYKNKYSDKIRLNLHTENEYSKGVPTLCKVMQQAKGKYIAICEGDDYWTDSSKLERQINYMEEHPKCSFLCTASEYINDDGDYLGKYEELKISKKFTVVDLLQHGYCFPTASYFFPSKYIEKVPEFYFLSNPIDDMPLQLLCTYYSYGYYLNEITCAYRQNSVGSWNQTVKQIASKRVESHNNMIKMYKEFNLWTDKKFEDSIKIAIIIEEFNIIMATQDYVKLKNRKYKKYIKTLNYKTRARLCFASLFPNTYKKMRTMIKDS